MKKKLLKLLNIATFSLFALVANANADFAHGIINEKQLFEEYSDFKANFQAFSLNEEEQKIVEKWPDTLYVEVFFGTWCHDSEREVPRLLKLLKANKRITTKLIALDYKKEDPQQLAEASKIKYTPTIVVYLNADKTEELGRIIERPAKSLVEDISQILPL
jgi:thioredoxin 1